MAYHEASPSLGGSVQSQNLKRQLKCILVKSSVKGRKSANSVEEVLEVEEDEDTGGFEIKT